LPGEKNNAKNNARCTQARKTMHGLDRQHQDADRTPCGRVNQNDRGEDRDRLVGWSLTSIFSTNSAISETKEDRDKWRKYAHGVANLWIENF